MAKRIKDYTIYELMHLLGTSDLWINRGYVYGNGNAYPLDMEVVEDNEKDSEEK